MLSIKPKTAFTNILEGGLPPTAINGHFDRYTKTILSEPPNAQVIHCLLHRENFAAQHFSPIFWQ